MWLVKRNLTWPQASPRVHRKSPFKEEQNEAKPSPGLREIRGWEEEDGQRMEVVSQVPSPLHLLSAEPLPSPTPMGGSDIITSHVPAQLPTPRAPPFFPHS